jgi:SAM-dependent MidA family methyltransferase
MPSPVETSPLLPEALGPYAPEESAHVARMVQLLSAEAAHSRGPLPFDRYMELALYAPGAGYYVAGARKFGRAGDFVTAPDISPLFGRSLALQCLEVLDALGGGEIFEFGAGAGSMAIDLLGELERRDALPGAYRILEVSGELRERQRAAFAERAPHLLGLVSWTDDLPGRGFRGVVLGNELLDAMPVHRFRRVADGVEEMHVAIQDDGGLAPCWLPAGAPALEPAVARLERRLGALPEGYLSEVNLRLAPWLGALGERVDAGLVLLIDYGYAAREYYHPERRTGTLVCHFRHRAHADPLVLPGLQDITANVDFSAVAEAGARAGFGVCGYATQAHFLIGCGIDELLAASDPADVAAHLEQVQGVKLLTLPSEMGERFKAIGLARDLDTPLRGFRMRDLRDRL